jgi:hypothetical protein
MDVGFWAMVWFIFKGVTAVLLAFVLITAIILSIIGSVVFIVAWLKIRQEDK